eukprot:gene33915-43814_t
MDLKDANDGLAEGVVLDTYVENEGARSGGRSVKCGKMQIGDCVHGHGSHVKAMENHLGNTVYVPPSQSVHLLLGLCSVNSILVSGAADYCVNEGGAWRTSGVLWRATPGRVEEEGGRCGYRRGSARFRIYHFQLLLASSLGDISLSDIEMACISAMKKDKSSKAASEELSYLRSMRWMWDKVIYRLEEDLIEVQKNVSKRSHLVDSNISISLLVHRDKEQGQGGLTPLIISSAHGHSE